MAKKSWQEQCREKMRFWQAHILAWEKSELSQNEYCRRQSLRSTQFCYWKKKLSAGSVSPSKVQFVPVPVDTTISHDLENDSGLDLQIGNVTIKVAASFNGEVLSRVLKILGHAV